MQIQDPTPEPVIAYRVWYDKNPAYKGDFRVPQKKGLQATVYSLPEALAAKQMCLKWYNIQENAKELPSKNGNAPEIEVKRTVHDNILCWIEQYENGKLQGRVDESKLDAEPEEEPEEEEKPVNPSHRRRKVGTAKVGVGKEEAFEGVPA